MQQPDPQTGHYFVTAIDGLRRYFLAGPWPTHAEALAQVDAVRRFAEQTDPRAVWMAYGTARQPIEEKPR
jgi:biotin carboxylase